MSDVASSQAPRVLLLADLSGYTGYLVEGEDEEAPIIAGDFVETVATALTGPFELAGLEGDAVFVHAPLATVTGDQVLEAIGRCHEAFMHRVESVRQATTCGCSACRGAPALELKFFVHVGATTTQRIAGRDELSGRDVILVHRLMKDSAPAELGMSTFALVSDAATTALGIDPAQFAMTRVVQSYDHFGDVVGWMADPRWWTSGAAELELEEPSGTIERLIPAPPPTVWRLLTLPADRERWEGIERIESLDGAGDPGVGSLSRCVARNLATIEEIVAWHPITSFTRRSRAEGSTYLRYDLIAAPGGTRLRVRRYGDALDGGEELTTAIDRLVALAPVS